jgi:hypothetical protein
MGQGRSLSLPRERLCRWQEMPPAGRPRLGGLSVCWHRLCNAHMTNLHGALHRRAQCTAGQHNPGEAGACLKECFCWHVFPLPYCLVLTWIAGDLVCRSGVATWALEANRAAGQTCANPGSEVKEEQSSHTQHAQPAVAHVQAASNSLAALTRWGRSAQHQSRCRQGNSRETPEWGRQ